jgi:hypothetical protein
MKNLLTLNFLVQSRATQVGIVFLQLEFAGRVPFVFRSCVAANGLAFFDSFRALESNDDSICFSAHPG